MDTVDTLLRGLAIGIQLTAALIVFRAGISLRARLRVLLFCVTIAGYTVVSSPEIVLPYWLDIVLLGLAMAAPAAIGWFAIGLFLDQPAPHPGWLIVALVALFLAWVFNDIVWVDLAHHAIVAVIYAGTLWLAVSTARGDLVQARRSFRIGFIAAVGLVGLMVTAVELISTPTRIDPALLLIEVAIIAVLSLAFALWVAGGGSEALDRRHAAPKDRQRSEPTLARRAEAAMQDGLWREEGLTIGGFANRLGVPEHRLRSAINRDLGYRNFPSFVNAWRISAAREALVDPERQGDTVLQIAYEVGFSSLGPFNRAFRDVTGATPTAYRRNAIPAEN